MNIFKFKDAVYGNIAFIIAETENQAGETLALQTSLPFSLIETKQLEDYPGIEEFFHTTNKWTYINNILPF